MAAESPFLAPKRPDFQWLEQNIHRLEVELGQVDQATFDTDTTFDTLNKVTTLLDSPEQITIGRKELNQQLIEDALSVRPVPACYEDKVTDAQKGIFVRVCDYFAYEVKRNSKVRRIFDSQTIARIYSQISIFYGILMEIRLKVDLTLQKLVKIEEMLEKQGVMLQSIKAGSVVLVVAGSAQAIQRLQVLFHSGELSEMLGVPVAAVELITSPSLPVRLSQWFQNLKEATEAGWLAPSFVFLSPAFRSDSIKRTKLIDLAGTSVDFMVTLAKGVKAGEIDIEFQVCTTVKGTYLPNNFKLRLLSEAGEILGEVQVQDHRECVKQPLSGLPGERFSVNLSVGNIEVTEDFVI